MSWFSKKEHWMRILMIGGIGFLFATGGVILWVATLKIPELQSFQDKVLAGSTKLYDKTGEVLLFDLNENARQQVVPFDEISPILKKATIAIEDKDFYEHQGINLTSIARAVLANITTMEFSQGGSTITQQVIKNSLLTADKKISRKIKEWVLALKLESVMSKDEILNLYLNGTSYGGNYYGIEEASKNFFAKSAKDLTLVESAYLAAIPQAPSRYSPYGKNRNLLDARKNLVLLKMNEVGYITDEEYEKAKNEPVTFKAQERNNIKAAHFVMYVKDYLIEKYGEEEVESGNLKVITTIDYNLQQKAEEIVKKYALDNEKKFNAENAALVAIDPVNGHILTMVGSRDYFDEEIDGNFNVTTANRQPGSAFKPFAYLTAFNKGFTPDTVLFDVPTQFSTTCDADGNPLSSGATCYMPQNYDLKFRGPMSMRNALAQSINVPAIKALYLAGLKDTLQTSQDLGITSLNKIDQYGLTLVLGGGEVSPLELTSAYGVFANNGIKNNHVAIVKITDRNGKVLEEFKEAPTQAYPEQSVLLLNNVLYDNNARLPLNGPNSPTDFPNQEVALKTGTTNDYRDVWIVGYTPKIAVGAWAGNNDNSSMVKKTSGFIIAPLWRAFMDEVLKEIPVETFKRPDPIDPNLKPILRGIWQGGQTYTIDKTTGKLATDLTPPELREERAVPDAHTILFWIDKNNPKGPPPSNPYADPQFNLWEKPVQAWILGNGGNIGNPQPPTQSDDVHTPDAVPRVSITSPSAGASFNRDDRISASINIENKFDIRKVEYYMNGFLMETENKKPFDTRIQVKDIQNIQKMNTLKVIAYDEYENRGETEIRFIINN